MQGEAIARTARVVRWREVAADGSVIEVESVEDPDWADPLAVLLCEALPGAGWAPSECREGRLIWRAVSEDAGVVQRRERLELLSAVAALHRVGLVHGGLGRSAVRRVAGRVMLVGLAGALPLDAATEGDELGGLVAWMDGLAGAAGLTDQERSLLHAVQGRRLALALAVRRLREGIDQDSTDSTGGATATPAGVAERDPLNAARVGRYALVGLLGRGGMGIVYRAYDPDLRREVAVKCLRLGGGTAEERFLAEARSIARLDHPNLVRVLDVGVQGDQPYFVMELVVGGSLAGRLETGPLEPDEALVLVASIARGLQRAHDAGIVHRDVKPSNILLHSEGHAKLSDFGVARDTTDTRGTGTGQVVGTLRYMAPEQAAGQEVGPAADIYALGLVLAECLTGVPPMAGAGSSWRDHATDSGRTHRQWLARLDPVIARALAPKPKHRYASMAEFAQALEQALRDRHPRRQAVRWAVGASTGVVAVAVALAVGWVAWQSAEHAAQLAAEQGLADMLVEVDELAERGFVADAEAAFAAWEESEAAQRVRSAGWRALVERRTAWGDEDGTLAAAASAWTTATSADDHRLAINELGHAFARSGQWSALARLAASVPLQELDPGLRRDATLSVRRDPQTGDGATRAALQLIGHTEPTTWGARARITRSVTGPPRRWVYEDGAVHRVEGATLDAVERISVRSQSDDPLITHVADSEGGTPIFAFGREPALLSLAESGGQPIGKKPRGYGPSPAVVVRGGPHPRVFVPVKGYIRDLLVLDEQGDGPVLRSADPAIQALGAFASPLASDLDGDGADELVVGLTGNASELRVLDGQTLALRARLPGVDPVDPVIWSEGPNPVILWSDHERSTVQLAQWRDGSFHPTLELSVSPRCLSVRAGDVDGDGRIDVVLGCQGDAELLWHSEAGLPVRRPLTDLRLVDVVDLDGDGKAEVVAEHERRLIVLGAGSQPLLPNDPPAIPAPPEGLRSSLHARWSRAHTLYDLGLWERAEQDFASLIERSDPQVAARVAIEASELWSSMQRPTPGSSHLLAVLERDPDHQEARRALVRLLESGGWVVEARAQAEAALALAEGADRAWWRDRLRAFPELPALSILQGGEIAPGWEVLHPSAVRVDDRGLQVRAGARQVVLRRLVRWDGRALAVRGRADTDWMDWASRVDLRLRPVDRSGGVLGLSVSAHGRKGRSTIAVTCRTPQGKTRNWQLQRERAHPSDQVQIAFRMDHLEERATCSGQWAGESWRTRRAGGRRPIPREPGVYALELRTGEQSFRGRTGSGHAPYAALRLEDVVIHGVRPLPAAAETDRARAMRMLANGVPQPAIELFDGSQDGGDLLAVAIALHDAGQTQAARERFAQAVRAGAPTGHVADLLRARPGVFESALGPELPALVHEAWGGMLMPSPLDPAADAVLLDALPDLVRAAPEPDQARFVVRLLVHRARALRRRGRDDEAMQHLTRATELVGEGRGADELPVAMDPWVQRAVYELRGGRPAEAMLAVQRSLDLSRAPRRRADALARMPELEPLHRQPKWVETVEALRVGK